ncbi:Threonine/homoserine efflux transporter RhtA [Cribrihabitans marinus]|uniref:Threonine/homoserine efflux transporter RhtA n=1 Tax=Cribrihabitans marinus TaxID=1227549 RepID=A0A1H7AH06_9RHOB|nr:DMT family transporter [Cribrihabitans marinus]GGH31747.1 hypothetical protein GCM10010973_22750 [Cribrihabitans marinus]SEJ64869.1 Threonine/homoserine efflux transporter RhtA [Cribrihabitans marinus]
MRLVLTTSLTMLAFAANSILNRVAVGAELADPGGFAVVRVVAGAVTLIALVQLRAGTLPLAPGRRALGAGALSLYMVGFSMAYLTLDAGLGALILFGVVQIAMFAYGALRGAHPTHRQVLGAAIAFAGLTWVLWPAGPVPTDPLGAALMALAGLGWAAYTLSGRGESDALAATAANFALAVPVTTAAVLAFGAGMSLTGAGALLAVISGAVTSGLGYALWYRVVPRLAPAVAATVQLSVPVIALMAGALVLGEAATPRLLAGATLVLGGIALAATRRPQR